MTLIELRKLSSALLVGDTSLTRDKDEFLMLLKYAFARIADEADAIKLLSEKDSNKQIVRNGPGGLFVRMPDMPESDNDELDIDEELTYAVARFICSFVSQKKAPQHIAEASAIIKNYNQKVSAYIETLEAEQQYPKSFGESNIYYGTNED